MYILYRDFGTKYGFISKHTTKEEAEVEAKSLGLEHWQYFIEKE